MKKQTLALALSLLLLASCLLTACGARQKEAVDSSETVQPDPSVTETEAPETAAPSRPESQTEGETIPDSSEPETVPSEPEIPTSEPEIPTSEPEVPTSEPEVSTSEPEVSTSEPEVPTSEPEIPTEEPEFSTEEPELPTEAPETAAPEIEPSTEPDPEESAAPPEETESEEPPAVTGADTLMQMIWALENDELFTEKQVDCMSQEFLFACLFICDPDHAADLFEARDAAAIAALLNERLFDAVGESPRKYTFYSYREFELTDAARAETQRFFLQNYDEVVEQYGAYYAQKVMEENEGREKLVIFEYKIVDETGKTRSGPEDPTSGLMFAVVNGRYYWNDFSLFESVSGD